MNRYAFPVVVWHLIVALLMIVAVGCDGSDDEPPPPGASLKTAEPAVPKRAEARELLNEAERVTQGDPVQTLALVRSYLSKSPSATETDSDVDFLMSLTMVEATGVAADRSVAKRIIDLIRMFVNGDIGPDIWNGEAAGAKYPECVAIGWWSDDFRSGGWCCSGVLVAKNAVLTADHCLEEKCLDLSGISGKLSNVWVYFGEGAKKKGINRRASTYHRFDGVTRDGARNDLAILVLEEDAPVKPCDFGSTPQIDSAQEIMIVGFGLTESEQRGEKRFGHVAVVSPSCNGPSDERDYECTKDVELIASDMIIEKEAKSTDSCLGDSGGPAFVVDGTGYCLAGVTSRSLPKSSDEESCGKGGIYTRVDLKEYQSWLEQIPGIRW